jgi:ribosome-binding factor A
MQGRRVDRIEEQLRIEISEIIEREIHDPRVGLATVTGVKISSDLRHARIFITALGDDEQEHKRTIQGLTSAAGYIRHALSKRLHHLKRIPELIFDYDESVEQSLRIAKLLDEIKTEPE